MNFSNKNYLLKTHCVLCNSTNIKKIFKLANTPLANSYPRNKHIKEKHFGLTIILCKNCCHLQLKEIINPKILFDNYVYVSGTSKVLKTHFTEYAKTIIQKFKIKKNENILDIACNDGTFLNNFTTRGYKNVVGIEPAKNLKKYNLEKKIDININYFSFNFSKKMREKYKSFKVITANNVCAHTPNLFDFFKGIKNILSKKGVFVFEVSYLLDVIDKLQFDTIYHEHMSYHSLLPLKKFVTKLELEIIDFERVKAQGGSIRVYVSHARSFKIKKLKIKKQIQKEINRGIFKKDTFDKFFTKIIKQKKILKRELKKFKQKKLNVVGYGAPAKLTTFCHLLNINKNDIEYIVDDNKLKQNFFSPGKKIPIKSFEYALKKKPDVIIVLAWNFFDSIVGKCKKYFKNKVVFIKAFPKIQKVN